MTTTVQTSATPSTSQTTHSRCFSSNWVSNKIINPVGEIQQRIRRFTNVRAMHPKTNSFLIWQNHLYEVIKMIKTLLAPNNLFWSFSTYSTGESADWTNSQRIQITSKARGPSTANRRRTWTKLRRNDRAEDLRNCTIQNGLIWILWAYKSCQIKSLIDIIIQVNFCKIYNILDKMLVFLFWVFIIFKH